MTKEKELTDKSKFLSLVLRHQPETIGIKLDENGWTDVNLLIEKVNQSGVKLDKSTLIEIVSTNSKKRFAFNENQDKIRASQGHSVNIELGYINQKPPRILFHGTSEKNVESILKIGLEKRNRQHVHLSNDIETALKVGQRHGKPIILEISTGDMFKDNFTFFISDNNVWLTDNVPNKYVKIHKT
ncbi:RNA 2'-phosphotransferase [Flavobacterium sp. xlx-214]|uniref:RNA 2'-phosphotransferase n=1 Tax=unclassified Flavobacterium TaxID=196869 RepID=UPI0013CFD1A1|nr:MULTISPECIES: RNA 2'-phosphotransferase [unclassified Flavobacterium]MBA5794048.1 RNA 2'-phosphotransferase [Flavobacterium sp. xlx-221]QMI83137.1 RNA 2'-phosphotransferase [Flavobacterium sp. xlx-214]